MFLWRAVDDEGEVLDLVVQGRRDTAAAPTLLNRLLRNPPMEPERIAPDGLRSYPAALERLGLGRSILSPLISPNTDLSRCRSSTAATGPR